MDFEICVGTLFVRSYVCLMKLATKYWISGKITNGFLDKGEFELQSKACTLGAFAPKFNSHSFPRSSFSSNFPALLSAAGAGNPTRAKRRTAVRALHRRARVF